MILSSSFPLVYTTLWKGLKFLGTKVFAIILIAFEYVRCVRYIIQEQLYWVVWMQTELIHSILYGIEPDVMIGRQKKNLRFHSEIHFLLDYTPYIRIVAETKNSVAIFLTSSNYFFLFLFIRIGKRFDLKDTKFVFIEGHCE